MPSDRTIATRQGTKNVYLNVDCGVTPGLLRYESTEEILGFAEDLGYKKFHKNRFDESQEGELQLTAHGVFNTDLGRHDF